MLDINIYKDRLNDVCSRFNLKKLDLFGSAATSYFNNNSDIDVIVEFDDIGNRNLFNAYFDFKDELCSIFQRPVDIVIESSIKNPFIKKSINKTRHTIYVKRNR